MAYDKVVDSAALDAGLKQIADAIREKGGTSDNLAFPAAMANAIADIEAGGNIVAGTYTPSNTQTSRVTITHNLGKTPYGVLFAKYNRDKESNDTVLFLWLKNGISIRAYYSNSTFTIEQMNISGAEYAVTYTNNPVTDIVCGLTNTTFQTPQNLCENTYVWVVFGEALI